jgi:tRNA(Ile)-lysidine synthase
MAEISGYIFRPFLTIPKSAILAYAKEHDIAYREDSSNISYIYERNQIRHDILPRIREINPSIEETLSELG